MRLNVYVPDELGALMRTKLPGVNVSALVQEALRSLLDCDHERVECVECGEPIDLRHMAAGALAELWLELLAAWEPLVDKRGTAEGAARLAKSVAVRMNVPGADRWPVPRPARALRDPAA